MKEMEAFPLCRIAPPQRNRAYASETLIILQDIINRILLSTIRYVKYNPVISSEVVTFLHDANAHINGLAGLPSIADGRLT